GVAYGDLRLLPVSRMEASSGRVARFATPPARASNHLRHLRPQHPGSTTPVEQHRAAREGSHLAPLGLGGWPLWSLRSGESGDMRPLRKVWRQASGDLRPLRKVWRQAGGYLRPRGSAGGDKWRYAPPA